MKRIFMLIPVTTLAVLLLSSCGHSRVWANKKKEQPARQQTVYRSAPKPVYAPAPLIISPHPGFTMARHANGQYFHRSPQGLTYWKGYDNRFYLDRNQIDRSRYSNFEYREWKRFSRHGS